MKVWLKAGVIIFYVLGYCFLRKRMRRDIVKLFKAYMLFMIFLLSLLPETFMLKQSWQWCKEKWEEQKKNQGMIRTE